MNESSQENLRKNIILTKNVYMQYIAELKSLIDSVGNISRFCLKHGLSSQALRRVLVGRQPPSREFIYKVGTTVGLYPMESDKLAAEYIHQNNLKGLYELFDTDPSHIEAKAPRSVRSRSYQDLELSKNRQKLLKFVMFGDGIPELSRKYKLEMVFIKNCLLNVFTQEDANILAAQVGLPFNFFEFPYPEDLIESPESAALLKETMLAKIQANIEVEELISAGRLLSVKLISECEAGGLSLDELRYLEDLISSKNFPEGSKKPD
jgi:DNA-binding phage protein